MTMRVRRAAGVATPRVTDRTSRLPAGSLQVGQLHSGRAAAVAKERGTGKAICAAARKLLTIVFVMLKQNLDYWYIEDRLYNQKLRDLQHAA